MVESLIIAALVIWSCYFVFKKVFPSTFYKLTNTLALQAQKQGWHRFSKWLQPHMPTGCSGGCGCESSSTAAAKNEEVKAIKWK